MVNFPVRVKSLSVQRTSNKDLRLDILWTCAQSFADRRQRSFVVEQGRGERGQVGRGGEFEGEVVGVYSIAPKWPINTTTDYNVFLLWLTTVFCKPTLTTKSTRESCIVESVH